MSGIETVDGYADLIAHGSLNVARADAVARALSDTDADVAILAPEWVLDSSDLSPTHHPEVVGVAVEHETGKAYLVDASGNQDWLPKSEIEVFEAEDSAVAVPGSGEE